MNQIRPYKEIPLIEIPENPRKSMVRFLAETYERQKFSHQAGWSQLFVADPILGPSLFTMDGSEHDHQRKIMNPAFTLNATERYLPLMQRVIRRRTAHWTEIGEIDLYEEMRRITLDITTETLIGLAAGEEADRLYNLFERILFVLAKARKLEADQSSLVALQQELTALLLPIIEERRQKPGDDVLSLLLQARDVEGRALSDEQVISHVKTLLLSGQQSLTNLSVWLLYLLHQHPGYSRRVVEEQAALLAPGVEPTLEDIKRMKVLELALMEAERIYPSLPKAPRGVVEDFDFNGYHVPAGVSLFCIAASHMLPGIFANPTQFDPDRFASPREEHKKQPFALVGFGGGAHMCIGFNFAQVEIKAITSYILRHYELEVLSGQPFSQEQGIGWWPLKGMKTNEMPPIPPEGPPWDNTWPGQVKTRVHAIGKGSR